MLSDSRVRALGIAGAVVSLLTGVATFGGALILSFGEVVPLVLLVLGLAPCPAFALFFWALVWGEWPSQEGRPWTFLAFAVVSTAFVVWAVVTTFPLSARDELLAKVLGASLLPVVVAVAVHAVPWKRLSDALRDPGSMQACPDCAETVKAAAKLCRFCGYRFGRTDSVSAPAPAIHEE